MAVQTIILRPNGQFLVGSTGNYLPTPSDAPDENLYLLINEETPDDYATYITGTTGASMNIGFPVELLSGILPTAIRFVVRMKSAGIVWGTRLTISNTDASGTKIKSIGLAYNENIGVWETISVNVDNVEGIKKLLIGATFLIESVYNTESKSGNASITQLYLEVDYDDEAVVDEEVLLHLKKSGAWEGISGKVYNKVNGAWVDGTLDALQADGLVVVQEVG